MLEWLLNVARAIRLAIYRISSARFLGVDVDIVLHFGFGALIFAIAERRIGARRAGLLLGSLILAKEIADLFLKSRLRYITRPSLPIVADILTDIATGVAGGLAVYLVRRYRRRIGAPNAEMAP
jgi:hypothetical protein